MRPPGNLGCADCGRVLFIPVPGVDPIEGLDDEATKVLGHSCADASVTTEGTA